MAEEILLKFKADQDSLNGSFKELEVAADKIEKDLSATFKLIAKESGGALDSFTKDLDELVKDIPRLKEFSKVMAENANSLDKNSEEFKTLNKLTKEFAANVAQLEKSKTTLNGVADNIGKATENTKSLKAQMAEAKNEVGQLALKFGATSKEATEAAARAAHLRDTLDDVNDSINASKGGGVFTATGKAVASVVSGVQAYEGALTLIGVESEDLQKTLVRLNGLMALSSGLQGLEDVGRSFSQLGALIKTQVVTAFTTLRGALIATGIGALAVGIGIVIANWEELVGWIEETFPAFKKVSQFFSNFRQVASGTLASIVAGFKVLGDVVAKLFQGNFSGAFASAKTLGTQMGAAYDEGFAKKDKELKEEAINRDKKHGQDKLKQAKDDNKRLKEEEERAAKELQKLQRDLAIKEINEKQKLQDEIEKAGRSDIDNKIQDIKDEYFEKIERAKQYGLDFEKLEKERDRKINELETQRQNKIQANIDSVGKSLGDAYNRGYQTAEDADEEFRDQRQKQFEQDKAMIMELATFAQNGLLLQLGLDPQSVERVKQSLGNALTVFNNEAATELQKFQAIADVTANAISTIGQAFFSAEKQRIQEERENLNAEQEEELRLAGDNEQKKEIIRQKFELKRRDLKRKEAESDKKQAIFQATINGFQAVASTLGKAGFFGIPLAAIVAGLVAGQIALIAAQPIPKFAKGGQVKDGMQKGKPHSAGGIVAEFEGNEFITKKSQAMKSDNLGLLNAINISDAERDRHINGHYILPAIKAKEAEFQKQEQARMVEIESLIASKVANNTLKGIHRELRETTNAVRSLKGSDSIKW